MEIKLSVVRVGGLDPSPTSGAVAETVLTWVKAGIRSTKFMRQDEVGVPSIQDGNASWHLDFATILTDPCKVSC
jgi:hypothetical protein